MNTVSVKRLRGRPQAGLMHLFPCGQRPAPRKGAPFRTLPAVLHPAFRVVASNSPPEHFGGGLG